MTFSFTWEDHCDPEPGLWSCKKIAIRETYSKRIEAAHVIGPVDQGRLLSMFSKMMQPRLILEIGTFTGYATICLAEGLTDGGIIHTIEVNHEMEEMLNQHFKSTNVDKRVRLHFGLAAEIIVQIPDERFRYGFH